MSIPAPRTPVEALEAIHRILAEGDETLSWSGHARQRMRERNVTVDDVLKVLREGMVTGQPQWHEASRFWRYEVAGRDYEAECLTLIVVLDPPNCRITLITVI